MHLFFLKGDLKKFRTQDKDRLLYDFQAKWVFFLVLIMHATAFQSGFKQKSHFKGPKANPSLL